MKSAQQHLHYTTNKEKTMLQDQLTVRRSVYTLGKNITLGDNEIVRLLQQCLLNCPTAFNVQSARLVVLWGEKHDQFWQLLWQNMQKVISAEKQQSARERIEAFKQAYGTILFYEDSDAVAKLQQQYPLYADNCPIWAQQANGMLQYMIWQVLAENNIGASLQHYNELVADAARQKFDLPDSWQMVAQMPFGQITAPVGNKTFLPLDERFTVLR